MPPPIEEHDLKRLLRHLRHRPHQDLGPDFTGGVMARLSDRSLACPPQILAAVASLVIAISATFGYAFALTHEHTGTPSPPPPLSALGQTGLLPPR